MPLTFIRPGGIRKMVAMAIFKKVLDVIRIKIVHGKVRSVSIQINWSLNGSKLLKETT